jgi:hypothetical protein
MRVSLYIAQEKGEGRIIFMWTLLRTEAWKSEGDMKMYLGKQDVRIGG